jgi:hypothetical protein
MITATIQDAPSDNLLYAFGAEAMSPSVEPEEIDRIALALWRHANTVDGIADECGCCKGDAQQCLAMCR